MKKMVAALALIAVLALTGCTSSPNIEDVAKAKAQCHRFGGTFTSWKNDFDVYMWQCDLSDKAVK
jgi:major membrane immunogen (membrane-anchored lipoprotein)